MWVFLKRMTCRDRIVIKGYVKALQEAGMLYDPDKVVWFHTEDRRIHPYETVRSDGGRKNTSWADGCSGLL